MRIIVGVNFVLWGKVYCACARSFARARSFESDFLYVCTGVTAVLGLSFMCEGGVGSVLGRL